MEQFSFFRSYYEGIKMIPDKQVKADAYEAIFSFMFDDKELKLEGYAKVVFELIRKNLESSKIKAKNGRLGGEQTASKAEANSKQKASKRQAEEKQSKANDKQAESKAEAIKKEELRIKNKELREKNKEEKKLSHSQQKFHNAFPNKPIDDEFPFDNNLVDDLIAEIKKSDFLVKCDNLGLRWCVNHINKILDGAYRDFKPKEQMLTHSYSTTELNELFDNLEEIDM